MTRREFRAAIGKYKRDAFGTLALALIVAGVWGLRGWQWGVIAAGCPFAVFYLYGEARIARGVSIGSTGDSE
jgi:hypothetical protein